MQMVGQSGVKLHQSPVLTQAFACYVDEKKNFWTIWSPEFKVKVLGYILYTCQNNVYKHIDD